MESSIKDINQQISKLSETSSESLLQKLNSILDKLPLYISDFIGECFVHKRTPREYQLLSILFAFATASGKTFFTDQLNYKNYPNIYGLIIGNRNDGKSEGIKMATRELEKQDDKYADDYQDEINNNTDEHKTHILKQMLVKDATIEAIKLVHSKCPNGIGIMMDEIRSLIENMCSNNSRDGKEFLSFFLEIFTNKNISSITKTSGSLRIKEGCCSLLGGLQKQFIGMLFSTKLLSSGFLDRLLCVNLIKANNKLSRGKINQAVIDRYNKAVRNILEYKLQSEKVDEERKGFEIEFTPEAQEKLFELSQRLEDMKMEAKSPLKEYLGKQSIYLHKLCIVVFLINRAETNSYHALLDSNDVNLAYEMVEFFILNFIKLIEQKSTSHISKHDIVEYAKLKNAPQKAVAQVTGLSTSYISKLYNKS